MSSKEDTGRGILLFSNRKYLFALGTFLINLQKYVSYDGVIVYHDDLSMDEQNAIRKIEPKVRFIKYGLDTFAKEFGFNEEKLKSIPFIQVYTVLAVSKFKIFKHLDEFSTLILFDLDMLILDKIDELLNQEFDIAWKNDGITIRTKLNYGGFDDESIKKLGMYDLYDKAMTPNGGFFVVRRTFDYRKAYEECCNYLKKFSLIHPISIDEVIFGYISEKMNLKVHCVDERVYNVFPVHISMKSKLIHFLGDYKPWNRRAMQAIYREWWNNYERYVKITGRTSNEVINYSNTADFVLQAYYSEKWNALFQQYGFIYPRELKLTPDFSKPNITLSDHGIFTYMIEINWILLDCYCMFWIDRDNKYLPVESLKNSLRELASQKGNFLSYQEESERFGVKTTKNMLWDVPNAFYHLYYITDNLRKIAVRCFAEIKTYHGTKIYVNFDRKCLVHATENCGFEVHACVKGKKVSLPVSIDGMNLYLKEISNEGKIKLTGEEIFFSCNHNSDGSMSIEVKDGSLLSADVNGEFNIRHWNKEWEHFFVQIIGTINE